MSEKQKHPDYIALGKRTVAMEAEAINALAERIDQHFYQACELLYSCKGKVVVTGVGKSGHIANKIASTLASTGTPAFFVHPAEAGHGDIGMIGREDVVIAISNSGNSPELTTLLPTLIHLQTPLIGMTGKPDSALAKASTVTLNTSVAVEACPLDLAPTSSTTTALVMGDALAVALLEGRGFTAEDFAFSHPGGTIGKRLLLKVDGIMHTGNSIPCVKLGAPLSSALLEITQKSLGITTVSDDNGKLAGVFTDGDLRRVIDSKVDVRSTAIDHVMSHDPTTGREHMLATQALAIMQQKAITALPIVNENQQVTGIIHIHDLLRVGI